MSQFSDRIIALISRNPEEREDHEIEMIIPWLKRKSEILQDFDKHVLQDIAKNCRYQKAIRDDVILKQGDTGSSFYIMITGRTSVYIDNLKLEDLDDENIDDINNTIEEAGNRLRSPDRKKSLDRSVFGQFVIHFEAGKSFGEIALISEDAIRNATIIADDVTDLMVIDRGLFNRSLKASQEQEFQERKDFINRSPIFGRWSPKLKRLLEMSFKKEVFPFNGIIVKQGTPMTGIYFVIRGNVKLEVKTSLHLKQFPQAVSRRQKEELCQGACYSTVVQEQVLVRRKEGYSAAEERQRSKTHHICSVHRDQMIGDIESVLNLDTYVQTAVCTTSTEVYVLNNKNYYRILTRRSPKTVESLRKIALHKLRYRYTAQGSPQLPGMRHLALKLEEMVPRHRMKKCDEEPADDKGSEIIAGQLSQLYMKGKAPLISPCVPGSLSHKLRSNRQLDMRAYRKSLLHTTETPATSKRRSRLPRSRRQLEDLDNGACFINKDNKERQTVDLGDLIRKRSESKLYSLLDTFKVKMVSSREHRPKTSQNFSTQTPPSDKVIRRARTAMVKTCTREPDETVQSFRTELCKLQKEQLDSRVGIFLQELELSEQSNKSKPWRSRQMDSAKDRLYYYDWETGDVALLSLERRLDAFYQKFDLRYHHRVEEYNPSLKLRRFHITKPMGPPVAGGTVLVKRKQCQFPEDHSENEHVRRVMLPENT